jgi:hypothetical protein
MSSHSKADHLIELEDDLGSTAIIDVTQIISIRHDVEGELEISLKGGGLVILQDVDTDIVENLTKRWCDAQAS